MRRLLLCSTNQKIVGAMHLQMYWRGGGGVGGEGGGEGWRRADGRGDKKGDGVNG